MKPKIKISCKSEEARRRKKNYIKTKNCKRKSGQLPEQLVNRTKKKSKQTPEDAVKPNINFKLKKLLKKQYQQKNN